MNDILKSVLIIDTMKDYILLKELCTNKNIAVNSLYSDSHVEAVGLGKIVIEFKKGNNSKIVLATCWVYNTNREAKDDVKDKKLKLITLEEFRYL